MGCFNSSPGTATSKLFKWGWGEVLHLLAPFLPTSCPPPPRLRPKVASNEWGSAEPKPTASLLGKASGDLRQERGMKSYFQVKFDAFVYILYPTL